MLYLINLNEQFYKLHSLCLYWQWPQTSLWETWYVCKSVCACACTCVYAHMHIHGGGLWPPQPPQKFKAQLLLQAKLQAIMFFYVKSNMYPMQSKCKTYGGYPPTSHKKFQCPITITKKDIAHYIFGCKTPYVLNAKVMQTQKYVHIRHNMSTPKFESPAKVLIPDKANYGELEHIYVNMLSDLST